MSLTFSYTQLSNKSVTWGPIIDLDNNNAPITNGTVTLVLKQLVGAQWVDRLTLVLSHIGNGIYKGEIKGEAFNFPVSEHYQTVITLVVPGGTGDQAVWTVPSRIILNSP